MVDTDTLQRWHKWAAQARARSTGDSQTLYSDLENEIFNEYVHSIHEADALVATNAPLSSEGGLKEEDLRDTERPTGNVADESSPTLTEDFGDVLAYLP